MAKSRCVLTTVMIVCSYSWPGYLLWGDFIAPLSIVRVKNLSSGTVLPVVKPFDDGLGTYWKIQETTPTEKKADVASW